MGMTLAFFHGLHNLWPLSLFRIDDLKASDRIVSKLSIPENTKRFVFAVRDPQTQAVIYILSAQNLSERSALDAECLIREIRPDAVVVQLGNSAAVEIQTEESELGNNVDDLVPTSSFGVLRRCFLDKINKEKYETMAGNLVLKEIFGVGFHGHISAAKRVAKEVGSSFLVLETPVIKASAVQNPSSESEAVSKFQGLVSSLVPTKAGSVVSLSSRRLCLTDDSHSQAVKLFSSRMDIATPMVRSSGSVSVSELEDIQLASNFQVPPFAQSIYPLLVDLRDIFSDLPSIGRALACSQKVLCDVSRGEVLDARVISEVYTFRIAVEGLRIALNHVGRLPLSKLGTPNKSDINFSELPMKDRSHALLAQALQSQTTKFKTIVAVVDASSLADLRKNWNTAVPPEVKDLVGQLVTDCGNDGEGSDQTDKKWLFSKKPVVAVGAGATAVLGASSLSKAFPASTVMKVVSLKLPSSLKLLLAQTQKTMAVAASKSLGPSKVLAPGLANSGVNTTSVLKTAASAEKMRTVAHSIIASIEKTSFTAMRTAFYEIMRKRRVKPIGFVPWATFGGSIATCTALLMCGDGIECAAESLPAAPSIASLGRGIQRLHQASLEVGQTDGTRIQKSIESLMHKLRKVKMQ